MNDLTAAEAFDLAFERIARETPVKEFADRHSEVSKEEAESAGKYNLWKEGEDRIITIGYGGPGIMSLRRSAADSSVTFRCSGPLRSVFNYGSIPQLNARQVIFALDQYANIGWRLRNLLQFSHTPV